MAATSSSALRSSRSGRLPTSKKEAPTRTKSTATPSESVKAKLVKVERDEQGSPMTLEPAPSNSQGQTKQEDIDPIGAASSSSSQLPPSQANAESQVQPRRSMTRTRKPSSRLMPSPSPPPSRSSSYHSSSKPPVASTTVAKGPQKKIVSTLSPTPPAPVLTPRIGINNVAEQTEEVEFGPGKRKRRPSTMTKPPSTIIKSPPTSGAAHLSASNLNSSSSAVPLKVRLTRLPSKSQTPEDKITKDKSCVTRKVAKLEQSLKDSDPAQTVEVDARTMLVQESDGEKEASQSMSIPLAAGGGSEQDGNLDANQAPRPMRKIILGRSKNGREKIGVRNWPYPSMQGMTFGGNGNTTLSTLEPPPLISRRGGLKAHHGFSHAMQRMQKGNSSDNMMSHSRSHSTSVLDGKWTWTPGVITPTLRFKLACQANEEESSEVSDMEDEDDFHQAMLEGDDFGELHHRKAASLSSKDSHRDSKSGDDSEAEDTPATTPRSPQSTCELPERRWSTGADDDEKDVIRSARDAVFAHALEPSSHRPHTHAGALTLSLPYQEISQGIDEDVSTRNEDPTERDHEREDEMDGDDEAILMSPAVHHSILGLSSKQHNMMLSSPQVSSAFASPALHAVSRAVSAKAEGIAPLSLPPPAQVDSTTLEEEDQATSLEEPTDNLPHTSQTEEDGGKEIFDRSALAVEPVENMCLSELEQAWEQSEGRGNLGEVEEESREDSIEKTEGEKGIKVKVNNEILDKTPRRTSKRVRMESYAEEKGGKKLRNSPGKAKVISTPSPARRLTRQSAVRT